MKHIIYILPLILCLGCQEDSPKPSAFKDIKSIVFEPTGANSPWDIWQYSEYEGDPNLSENLVRCVYKFKGKLKLKDDSQIYDVNNKGTIEIKIIDITTMQDWNLWSGNKDNNDQIDPEYPILGKVNGISVGHYEVTNLLANVKEGEFYFSVELDRKKPDGMLHPKFNKLCLMEVAIVARCKLGEIDLYKGIMWHFSLPGNVSNPNQFSNLVPLNDGIARDYFIWEGKTDPNLPEGGIHSFFEKSTRDSIFLTTINRICECGEDESVDSDGDGSPDCADECINDPNKIEPGECGCGYIDNDTDGDGVLDCNDGCPFNFWLTEPPCQFLPDIDGDNDVDQNDYGLFQKCFLKSDEECFYADFDSDGDVDSEDQEIFENCATGPSIPFDIECLGN